MEGSLSADSKSRCETTTGRDNELFWTKKFIVPAGAQFNASIAKSCPPLHCAAKEQLPKSGRLFVAQHAGNDGCGRARILTGAAAPGDVLVWSH
jgi:hypothetical protein